MSVLHLIKPAIFGVVGGSLMAISAFAAGLSPMKAEGFTPSDKKAFYLMVINPYRRTIDYELNAYEADLRTPARGILVNRKTLRVPGQRKRKIVLVVTIPENQKEREIALCVHSPSQTTFVLARVCGRYLGKRYR